MELDYIKLKEIKPALAGYVKEAQTLLDINAFPDEKVVHDVRVLLKKKRAVLRLIAQQMDSKFVDREKRACRDVSRLLSSWRESSVIRKSIKELKKERPDIFLKLKENGNLNILLQKPEPVNESVDDVKACLSQIKDMLNKIGYRIRFEPMNNLDPQLLLKGLEVTYNTVVNDYLICRNNPVQTNIHELRKRSKDFLYQLWFFRPLNVPVIKALEKKLDAMSQNLGKYNDLARIIEVIGYKYIKGANQPELDELVIIMREKQDYYLSKFWPVAYKIFCPGQNLVNLLGFKLLVI
jgi:CHAD domain-containing protein